MPSSQTTRYETIGKENWLTLRKAEKEEKGNKNLQQNEKL